MDRIPERIPTWIARELDAKFPPEIKRPNNDQLRQRLDDSNCRECGINAHFLFTCLRWNMLQFIQETFQGAVGDYSKIAGIVLMHAADPKIIGIIARFQPDCTIKDDNGFTAYDLFNGLFDREMVDAYHKSGLPHTPLHPVIAKYLDECAEIIAESSWLGKGMH